MRRLPLLDRVRVTSPCDEPWDEMLGDDRARHCARCYLAVHNLSAMTTAEVERLADEHEGVRLCKRYRLDHGGRLITGDRRGAVLVAWLTRLAWVAALLAVVSLLALPPAFSCGDQRSVLARTWDVLRDRYDSYRHGGWTSGI